MSILFTSDLHFGHTNAIKFDNRPFSSAEEMDACLIDKWNNKIHHSDHVYVLGDMFWKSDPKYVNNILRQLKGQITVIKGNHDKWLRCRDNWRHICDVKESDDIKVTLNDGTVKRCILSHWFMPFYNGHYHGTIHLHGHTHNSPESVLEKKLAEYLNKNGYPCSIHNVGCMHWNYEPVTLDEILNLA